MNRLIHHPLLKCFKRIIKSRIIIFVAALIKRPNKLRTFHNAALSVLSWFLFIFGYLDHQFVLINYLHHRLLLLHNSCVLLFRQHQLTPIIFINRWTLLKVHFQCLISLLLLLLQIELRHRFIFCRNRWWKILVIWSATKSIHSFPLYECLWIRVHFFHRHLLRNLK